MVAEVEDIVEVAFAGRFIVTKFMSQFIKDFNTSITQHFYTLHQVPLQKTKSWILTKTRNRNSDMAM